MGFIVAIFIDFRMQALCALSVPILFAFVFYFVPESPFSLYKKNKIEVTNDDTLINQEILRSPCPFQLGDISLEFYKGKTMSPESEKFMADKKSPDDKDNGLSISDFG